MTRRTPNRPFVGHANGWTIVITDRYGLALTEGARDTSGNPGIGILGLTDPLKFMGADWCNYTVTPKDLTPTPRPHDARTYHMYPLTITDEGPAKYAGGRLAALVYIVDEFRPHEHLIRVSTLITESGPYYQELLYLMKIYTK